MNGNLIDWSKLKHWQVMDPAPEIFQYLPDDIKLDIIEVQIQTARATVKAQAELMDKHLGAIEAVIAKARKR